MNFFYLLFSIVGESGGYIFDRLNFKKGRIKFRPLMFFGFLGMIIFVSLFILLTGRPSPAFSWAGLTLMCIIITVSFISNIFDYMSLKADDLSIREPLVDFYPILAGLIAYVFYPAEREPIYILSFIAGTLVVWWGIHRIKLGKVQKKGLLYLLIAVSIYSFLPSLYKQALDYISPEYITLFRVSGILVLVSIFLPFKKRKSLTPKRTFYVALSSMSGSVGVIAGLYAIQAFGVVMTMVFLMLGPAIRYLAGFFILKEKVRRSEVTASLMLSVIVAVTAFIK